MRVSLTLRELFLVILLVATVSLFLNIQANNYGVLINSRKLVFASNVTYDVIEGSFLRSGTFKIVGVRSLSQHEQEVSSQHDGAENDSDLLQRLKKLEDRLLLISRQPVVALVDEHTDNNVVESLKIQNVVIETRNKTDHLQWVDESTVVQNGNWSMLLCADSNQCPDIAKDGYKKVNSIKAIEEYINNPDKLCMLSRRIDEKFQDLNCDNQEKHTSEALFGLKKNNIEGPKMLTDLTQTPLPLSPFGPVLRLRLLVTSLVPLRFYLHSSILSRDNDTTEFHEIFLEDIFQYISETYGLGTSSRWWTLIQTTLVKYLTQISRQEHIKNDYPKFGCIRCFMDFFADVECISMEHCLVTKLSSKTNPVFRDTFDVTTFHQPVLADISRVIQIIKAFQYAEDEMHLTNNDLVYLIDGRLEQMAQGNWIKIYPSKNGNQLFSDITDLDLGHKKRVTGLSNQILSYIEQNFAQIDTDYRNSMDLPYDVDLGMQYTQLQKEIQTYDNPNCIEDPDAYRDIDTIYSDPELTFTELKPRYLYSTVGYDTIIIRVGATAKSCRCVVKMDNKYNQPGAKNISIGLGNNTFHLLVIDKSYSDPKVVTTITVTINRQSRGAVLTPGHNYRMCELEQDCSLPFHNMAKCGLSESRRRHMVPKHCASGDEHGRWVVPCSNCLHPESCVWCEAKWQPYICTYTSHSKQSLKQCLKNKKLLFIGDSTNRGIMNYMMEQVNGSLRHWDKVHNTRHYVNLNNNSTHFTFSYYPLFWLPAEHRPKFQKIIYQLIKSSLPLHNNASTVLVVGGVQWLAKEHIDSIIEALKRKGLQNITVVIKGLGAGFHQPVEGVRFVPKDQQYFMQQKESQILSYAKEKGFRVVSTFNMTLARYKDFMEGKCACHFHKVSKILQTNGEDEDIGARYSVSGDVNEAYSNIAINQICG